MRTKKSISTVIATILLIFGLVGLIKTYLIQRHLDSLTLLEMPVDLHIGETYDNEFTVSSEGRYFIWITFNRDAKTDELACKVGMDPDYYNCSGIESLTDLSWEILNNNEVVMAGSSSDYPLGNAGSELEKTIAQVQLSTGVYDFKMTLHKDASELNSIEPKVKIAQSPLDIQSELIPGALLLCFSVLIFSIGLLIFSIKCLLKFSRKHLK